MLLLVGSSRHSSFPVERVHERPSAGISKIVFGALDVSDRRVPSRKSYPTNHGTTVVETHMTWHPLNLLRVVFAVLVVGMVVAGLTTRARPQTTRQWMLVWVVVVFLTWVLLGLTWLRA